MSQYNPNCNICEVQKAMQEIVAIVNNLPSLGFAYDVTVETVSTAAKNVRYVLEHEHEHEVLVPDMNIKELYESIMQ